MSPGWKVDPVLVVAIGFAAMSFVQAECAPLRSSAGETNFQPPPLLALTAENCSWGASADGPASGDLRLVAVLSSGDEASLAPFTSGTVAGSGDNYIDVPSLPFQIPLGALLPVRVGNLIPACKNIGTTHVTNGCYRLHPVEWNIGEAAGALAAYCMEHKLAPRQVRNDASHLADFQRLLAQDLGIPLAWPPYARITPR